MFPCPRCKTTPAQQVTSAATALKQADATFNTFWFDVEGTQYWKDVSYNQNWLNQAVTSAKSMGLKVGIYTKFKEWQTLMRNSTAFSSYPLWYANFNEVANFADFKPFGGWKKAAMKQYTGDTSSCSVSVDLNYY